MAQIEKLLESRSLLPDDGVNTLLLRLEEMTLAWLRAGEIAEREQARLALKAIHEYRALRAFAVRSGWAGSGKGWPLRSEDDTGRPLPIQATPATPPSATSSDGDAATVVLKPA